MIRITLFLTSGLLIGPAADDKKPDPRAVIQQAIKAHGETRNGKTLATYMKARFQDKNGKFTMESFRSPDGKFKETVPEILDRNDRKLAAEMLVVFDGTKGWNKIAGFKKELFEFTADEYEQARQNQYLSRVFLLVDLLQDQSFRLSYLGEETVGGQKVVGVRVVSKGHGDVRLYFDKDTRLSAALRWQERSPRTKKEVAKETIFSAYRDLKLAASDEKALQNAGVPLDGPGALAFLRKLIGAKADRDMIRTLVDKLGDSSFKIREEATARLKNLGPAAIPFLQKAVKGNDEEAARRARVCLDALKKKGLDRALVAAVRQVGYTRPPGATEVLLDLVPHAPEEKADEVRAVLAHRAKAQGKPDPVLLAALDSKEDWRRETAIAVLGRDGGAYLKRPGRRLYLKNSKYPGRVVHFEDGKQAYEEQILEVQYFNSFDERLFRKPE